MQTTTKQVIRKPLAQSIALGLFAAFALPAQATNYNFSDLGTIAIAATTPTVVQNLNNLGHVVAFQYEEATATGWGKLYGSLWNGSSWSRVTPIGDSVEHQVVSLNDHDQVAGWVKVTGQDLYLPYRWDDNAPTQLERLSSSSWFAGPATLNNAGSAAGGAFGTSSWVPVRWNAAGEIEELPRLATGDSYPAVIADSGAMAGFSNTESNDFSAAVYWDAAGNIHEMQTLAGTTANGYVQDLNNLGGMVGESSNAEGTSFGVYWADPNATPVPITANGFLGVIPWSVNDLGQIVGWGTVAGSDARHVLMFDNGTVTDLSLLVPADLAAAGWELNWYAPLINNNGQIAGQLTNPVLGLGATYLFTPTAVPVPGAVWLFGSALAGLIGLRRKDRRCAREA